MAAWATSACAKKAAATTTCGDQQPSREQLTIVLDVTDGGADAALEAGAEQDACVVDCPGVAPSDSFTDAASCGPPCMQAAADLHYDDPRLVGCRESSVSILCVVDTAVTLPCDPIPQ